MRKWLMPGALGGAAVAVQAGVGAAVASSTTVAVVTAGAILTAIVVASYPTVIALIAFPSAFAYWRVGPTEFNLSVADVALAVAVLAVLPLVPWRSPHLSRLLKVLAAYLVILGVAVVAEPSSRAFAEWAHRALLVGGGICVGAALATPRLQRVALGLYLAMATAFAVDAIVWSLGQIAGSGGLPPPAYPFALQKNPAALLIAIAALMIIVVPRRVPVPRGLRGPLLLLLFLGVLACQSRGTAVALVAVLIIRAFQERRLAASAVTLVGASLLVAMTWITLDTLLQSDARDSRSDPISFRIDTSEETLDLWTTSPITGVGLKFWRDPDIGGGDPHNAIVTALGESGLVGLIALAVLVVGSLVAVRRIHSGMAELAFLVLLAKFLASMVDVFWVAGTFTVPWLLVGMAVGTAVVSTGPPSSTDHSRRHVAASGPARP